MALPFTTLDVFTETPFQGNPLALVTIPPGTVLTQAQKQTIAREFNLSETTFVHDVEASSTPTDTRRFDIFTPSAEIPFAGHPTIGTAAFLYSSGVRTLLAKSGPIRIERTGDGALRAAVPHNIRLHQKRLSVCLDPGPGAGPTLTLQAEVARAEHEAPLFSIVKGMTFALIELPSLEHLGAVTVGGRPDLPAELLDDGWRDGWVTRRYYFVRLSSHQSAEGGRTVHKIRTRMIKLTMEDPATGSAACALSSYLSLYVLQDRSATFEITQGVEMGRESKLLLDIEVATGFDGERKLGALHLGGKAVPVMSGSIMTPP